MIRCTCTVGHREHDYRAGNWGLCTVCGHGVGVHKPLMAETAQRIIRLLQMYDVADLAVTSIDDGRRLRLDIRLVTA